MLFVRNGQAEVQVTQVLAAVRRIDLSWVRIEIALLVGVMIMAG